METLPHTAERPPVPNLEKLREDALSVLSLFESDEYFIDEGGAGRVFELPVELCMKLVEDRHNNPNRELYDLGNSAQAEMRFQEKLANTKYSGKTRVPKVVGVLADIDAKHRSAIVMERLRAINLQHIINGDAEFPPNFDLDSFFIELEEFVEHMHSVEKVAHKDLYARNIMVDVETGDPRIIDFGRSKSLGVDLEKNKVFEDDDWKRLEEIYKALVSLQKK